MAGDTGPLTTKRSKYSRSSTRKSVYLWEFLFGLLEDDECASVISWTNKLEGIFTLKNTNELAKLWGTVKNKPNMDKYKLFRAMRNYYNTGMLRKVKGRNSMYQFVSIPYETEGCETCSKPPVVGSPAEYSLTNSDWCERLTDHFERIRTADNCSRTVDYRKSTENNGKSTTENCEQMEESFNESNGYIVSRATSLSGYSMSSDSIMSTKSSDELQADLLNIDIKEQISEND
ncbi:ETS-related transcription factor Elf-1-like isoform X2 [Paramuricea clavata]|uniref:ETS-related transcription factor Elf-1-like isoform X2 n=1 Tax=Paramuricea clavata TaxID=317549 RepID=A0A6S7HDP6_PARCT|nr:ETS-related transcription factor Elf-1-like isoform X2 [Paramuricea clavata]